MQVDTDNYTPESDSGHLQIYFSAKKLLDHDIATINDTFLVILMQDPTKPRKQVLRTKTYWNDANPQYKETLITQFYFEIRQILTVEVYHEGNPSRLVGTVSASIGQIFASREQGLNRAIIGSNDKKKGVLTMRSEKIDKGINNHIQFNISARDLPSNKFFMCFGDNCPIFRVYKIRSRSQYLLYESQQQEGVNPKYQKITMNERKLCNNSYEQEIIIKFYNSSPYSQPSYIAQAKLSINDLLHDKHTFDLKYKNKKKGTLIFSNFNRYTKHDFTDYIFAGMQMSLLIGIDFTASNGKPQDSNSLHYCSQTQKSTYEKALKEVATIILDYDKDKLVPTYGFGARVKMNNVKSIITAHHSFPINGMPQNPKLKGLQGILQTYRSCMKYIQFCEPTYFAPIIREAIKQCKSGCQQTNQEYNVLLLLTDGTIDDKEQVIDLLSKCARLPISIVIAGIGNRDWSMMEELDNDEGELTDKDGKQLERDLVQFVQMNQLKNDGVLLAKQVLKEIPKQIEEYHMLISANPKKYKSKKCLKTSKTLSVNSRYG